ncbi:hypothetical protein MKW98_016317 [Papaver atlanticum]|uniref:F-box domain-containing protein n=1 Tax=Papaver atlanticum TaxID=357466 RepID=A0AAD4SH70_9MAGN|nr:hypothetical protein MKW98_016317 [Papaver atlanticum]
MKIGNSSSSSEEEEKDRISNLPDSLIEHILSFTDTKSAVQTCVLAKRWRYIWISLPVLTFYDTYHSIDEDFGVNPTKRFIKFVDKVLSLRDNNSDIRRFDLHYDVYFSTTDEIYSCMDRWIATAVSHNVQEMCICVTPDRDFEIPLCLCTCKSLTKLELELSGYGDSYYYTEIILPDHEMSLPLLKSLRLILWDISFDDEELTNRFFSSFPSLESLVMRVHDNPFPEMNLNISLPKLKYFEFDSWGYESNCEVKLHAPSLSSFIFRSYLSTNLSLMNLSSLATADIEIRIGRSEVPEMCAQRAMGLLRGIHDVEVLTLDHNFLEVEFDPDNIGDDWDAGLSLPCRICHLKIAEIKGLRGHAIELKFLELLLKHATVLEKVVLTNYSTEQDSEREKRMTKFSETLLTFPTTSKKILILLKF